MLATNYKGTGSLLLGVDWTPEKNWHIPRLSGDVILPPYVGDMLDMWSDGGGEFNLFFNVEGERPVHGKYPEWGSPGWEERTPSTVAVFVDDNGNSHPLDQGVTEHLFDILHEYIMEAPIDVE